MRKGAVYMARRRGEAHFLWRLILIPAFLMYLRLFDSFDFLMNLGKVNFVEYARNFLILSASAIGLVCLMLASPGRRLLLSAGLVLVSLPMWLETGFHMGAAGLAVDEILNANAISVVVTASGALWGTLMVRGPKGREWEKAVLFLFLLVRSAAILMWPPANIVWFTDARLFVLAVCAGALADSVYRGPCLGDALVPLISGAWMAIVNFYPALDVGIVMYAVCALALVGATYFMCSKPAKNLYAGFILTLLGAACVSASYLINSAGIL